MRQSGQIFFPDLYILQKSVYTVSVNKRERLILILPFLPGPLGFVQVGRVF